jgi:predicted nucleotidyltransferase
MDYPMTSFEIWKYLFQLEKKDSKDQSGSDMSLPLIAEELEGEKLKKIIEEYHGFFFLKGRKSLVDQRINRNKISESKIRILLKVTKILRFVPYVRMIAVTGRMAMKNAEEKSDLDVLIVIKEGRIFTGRTLVTLAVHLMGKRRYRGKIANRVCLNYFITTNSLEISMKDMYSSSEYYFMLPLFGKETFRKFQKDNRWISEYKANYQETSADNLKTIEDDFLSAKIRYIGEKIFTFNFIEKILKTWQIKRINKNPKTNQIGSMVVASDEALVFLPNPQGPKIYDKFKEKISSLY